MRRIGAALKPTAAVGAAEPAATVAAGEFDLIERIRARCGARADVLLGIGDDAALLQPPGAGEALCVCVDTLNIDVHFPAATPAFDIGWKALAVNLSDLAAMGARPRWATLSLSLPDADAGFVDRLLDGFFALAELHDLALVGGDTTRGPLSVSVQLIGVVDPQRALRRAAARAGDALYVSGTIGDAAAGLGLLQSRLQSGDAGACRALIERLDRPQPRLDIGLALAGIAGAAIDISDGLLADLGHVLTASGVGACIELEALPTSSALLRVLPQPAQRWPLQLAGGDDYELLLCGDTQRIEATDAFCRGALTRIGRIEAIAGLRFERAGQPFPLDLAARGFDHFANH